MALEQFGGFGAGMGQAPMPQAQPEMPIEKIIQADNVLDVVSKDKLEELAGKVKTEYDIDFASNSEWIKSNDEAIKLAKMVSEEKNYPFERASNVKYPLLTVAALQFNARAYPAIVNGSRVAKCMVWGADKDGAKAKRSERVSEHLSHQLLVELPEWEHDTDQLLVALPICGTMFRKVWYDPAVGNNTTRLIFPDKLIVNASCSSMERAPRITERMFLYPYEIEERIRSGRFKNFDYANGGDNDDPDSPHEFLEQHRLIDLDEDGYPEPYVVTMHVDTQTVCRIAANFDEERVVVANGKVISIRRRDFYIPYNFLPSLDGGFYGTGFGSLIGGIAETINSTLNQMIDAGHLSNIQGGLVSSVLTERERKIRIGPGEWKTVHINGPIRDAMMPISYPGPSETLFKLLGLLIESGNNIASVKDVMTGEGVGKNASPTTTLALIEQGMQVFTAIFKRVHRSLKQELKIHSTLNEEFVSAEKYNELFDEEQPVDPKADYNLKDMDILPVSDPNMASRMQELAKAQFLLDTGTGNPLVDQAELLRRVWEAGKVQDIDTLFTKTPQPNPQEEQMKQAMAQLVMEREEAEIGKILADSIKSIAQAEGEEVGQQMDSYRLILDALNAELGAEQNGQGGVRGMAGESGNPMGNGPSDGQVNQMAGQYASPAGKPSNQPGTTNPPA